MICLKCDSEDFVLDSDAIVEQDFRGEKIQVRAQVMVCQHCGWQALAEGQMDELGRKVADAYRGKHGLLTSREIKGYREQFRLSQREFAQKMGVGEASVKRWETWLVQDRSSDSLIRLKASQMLEELQSERPVLRWFSSGVWAIHTTVVSNAGIHLRPQKDPVHPNWRMGARPQKSQPTVRRRSVYDPAFPIAA